MKSRIKIALVVVFFIALAGFGIGLYLLKKEHKDLQNVNPDYVITAVDLQKAFEDNEVSATTRYVNRVIEVTGVIESVKTVEENALNISLKTGSDLSLVICTFPSANNSANLIPGNQVTIRGECSGYLMDVLLNNCVLIK
jgi:hypothetical protein